MIIQVLKLQKDWIAEEMKEVEAFKQVKRSKQSKTILFLLSISSISLAVRFVCLGRDQANCCCVFMAQWLLFHWGPF